MIFLKYLPHGINSDIFHKNTTPEELTKQEEFKTRLFGKEKVNFVVLYNSRNIRRKMTGDVILAFREFVLALPKEKRDACRLVLRTEPVDENGTDLPVLIRDCAPEIKVHFVHERIDLPTMNNLYNISDAVINLSSAEGFGLSVLEGIMTERVVIINVTGGMQDQAGFVDENGVLLHEDIHFKKEWGSNHAGPYTKCGEWAIPVFPAARGLIGSPPTPYIFDDRCKWEDAAVAIRQVYDMSKEERARRGALGREFAMNNKFHLGAMAQGFIDGIDAVLEQWKPRKSFELFKG